MSGPPLSARIAGFAIGAGLGFVLTWVGWHAAQSLAAAPDHPEPDSAVMEPSADGSHWVTPAGTRVYLLHAAGMVCAVAETRFASTSATGAAISCLPAEVAP